jgi:hypothetical protein
MDGHQLTTQPSSLSFLPFLVGAWERWTRTGVVRWWSAHNSGGGGGTYIRWLFACWTPRPSWHCIVPCRVRFCLSTRFTSGSQTIWARFSHVTSCLSVCLSNYPSWNFINHNQYRWCWGGWTEFLLKNVLILQLSSGHVTGTGLNLQLSLA